MNRTLIVTSALLLLFLLPLHAALAQTTKLPEVRSPGGDLVPRPSVPVVSLKLPAVTGVSFSGGNLQWDAVSDGTYIRHLEINYRSNVNGSWRTITRSSTLTSTQIVNNINSYEWVQARIRKISQSETFIDSDWTYACSAASCESSEATATPVATSTPVATTTPEPSNNGGDQNDDPGQDDLCGGGEEDNCRPPGDDGGEGNDGGRGGGDGNRNSGGGDQNSGGNQNNGGNQNSGGNQNRGGPVGFSVLKTPSPNSESARSRRNAVARPSLRDGVMLSFDGRLNPHAGAPVAAYAGPDSLNFWHILTNSEGISIGSIPDVNALAQAGHAGGELLRGTHPESGKTVTVTYRPGFRMLEVSTFYADTEHQANKLYTFCIMPDNSVETVLW